MNVQVSLELLLLLLLSFLLEIPKLTMKWLKWLKLELRDYDLGPWFFTISFLIKESPESAARNFEIEPSFSYVDE